MLKGQHLAPCHDTTLLSVRTPVTLAKVLSCLAALSVKAVLPLADVSRLSVKTFSIIFTWAGLLQAPIYEILAHLSMRFSQLSPSSAGPSSTSALHLNAFSIILAWVSHVQTEDQSLSHIWSLLIIVPSLQWNSIGEKKASSGISDYYNGHYMNFTTLHLWLLVNKWNENFVLQLNSRKARSRVR